MQAPTYSNKHVRNNFPIQTKASSHDWSRQPQKFRHILQPYSVDLGVNLLRILLLTVYIQYKYCHDYKLSVSIDGVYNSQ